MPPAEQGIDALSNSAARAQLQKQAVLPNSLFSRSGMAPVNALLQSTGANGQTVWSLEGLPSGTIKRSEDGGRTWKAVVVDGATRLYALSANGSTIWVGGGNGKLFRSVDGGVIWTPVQLTYAGEPVEERIVRIDAGGGSVRVKTASGLAFVSTDGGTHWERE
jgi:photosystem II stability/assembly factor-like uncharacterized protein